MAGISRDPALDPALPAPQQGQPGPRTRQPGLLGPARDPCGTVPAVIDSALAVFQEHLPELFGIAYRMLGSVADAEDILQDAWLKWSSRASSAVTRPLSARSVPVPAHGADKVARWILGAIAG
jgi:Sigma-70 region 2